MEREKLVSFLKEYQLSEKALERKADIERLFLQSINRRVIMHNGKCAECAVRKVLGQMFAVTVHPILCLDAILELCRDDAMEFTELQDADLICRINASRYFTFTPLTGERLVVETQEGVV